MPICLPVGEPDALCCPACGGTHLHHEVVDVYDRKEDAHQGLHVRVDGSLYSDHDLSGNPSRRRGGLVVVFWCETCGATSSLAIAQHKGTTQLCWLRDEVAA